ncbi:hypothetical protein H8E50_02595 [bacterium]|nr:hypothetical protein [bacterium]
MKNILLLITLTITLTACSLMQQDIHTIVELPEQATGEDAKEIVRTVIKAGIIERLKEILPDVPAEVYDSFYLHVTQNSDITVDKGSTINIVVGLNASLSVREANDIVQYGRLIVQKHINSYFFDDTGSAAAGNSDETMESEETEPSVQ